MKSPNMLEDRGEYVLHDVVGTVGVQTLVSCPSIDHWAVKVHQSPPSLPDSWSLTRSKRLEDVELSDPQPPVGLLSGAMERNHRNTVGDTDGQRV